MTTILTAPPEVSPAGRPRRSALLLGREEDARWVRPSLIALLVLTGVLYLWGLGESGWANAFYSAAAQAGSESWKALFYGSSDAANSITVDKTPAALWIMALSVRLFGLNSWSILVPQALIGVATTALLYATVRRHLGPAAGLIAGAVMALTPVAVLMFRFNNPDALLVLLMTAAAWATMRAVERGGTKWLVWAGVFIGFGFLTKMLQALLVVPALGLTYLLFGPPRLGRRIAQLLLAGLAIVVSAGWWIAIVELVPASMRPWIGGSQNNSILELTLGYNGLGRLSGNETGSVGGGGAGGGMWGETGLLRMFDSTQGGQISWLLPAALILLVAGLALTRRAPRTDPARAALVLWGAWLVLTGLVFSLMQGIFHAYYTVALAPAAGAVVGIGAVLAWRAARHRARLPIGTVALCLATAVTAWWSYHLLGRSADFLPWLKWVVLAGGLVAAVGLAVTRRSARFATVIGGLALGVALAGPAAYAVQTASQPHTGSIPSAGPAVAGGFGGPGGGRGPGGARGRFPGGFAGGGFPGGAPGGGNVPGAPGGGNMPGGPGGARGGGMGGLLDAATVSDEMKALLEQDAGDYTWAAAAVGSQSASGYQLATGEPVMAIGGFNGSDPSPTLAQFQRYVTEGKIHYFIGGGGFAGGPGGAGGFGGGPGGADGFAGGPGVRGGSTGGSNFGSQIAQWVAENFTARTVGGVTIYDLTAQR